MKKSFFTLYGIRLLAAFLVLSSCNWFKPAKDPKKEKVYSEEDIGEISGGKVFDKETGEWRTVREPIGKLDTIRWVDLPEDKFPPITTGTGFGNNRPGTGSSSTSSSAGTTFRVSLLIPFYAKNATSHSGKPDDSSLQGLQFYSGAKLAYENLQAAGINMEVSVWDTEGSANKVSTVLRNPDVVRSDLIIGPFKRENVTITADFARTNQVPVIIPYTAQMGITEKNPFYIQVNPSLKSHCEAITRHARKRYRTDDIILVVLDNADEKARLKYFHDANALVEGRSFGTRLTEVLIPDNPSGIQKINVRPYIRTGRTTVFIVPSWSNETFVYSLLRQLMVEKSNGEDIVVYGMPAWMNYEQIDPEFYEKLSVHVSSSSYINPQDERIRQFRRKFYNTYGTIPTDDAFAGYDIMLYFGQMLQRWGKDFYKYLDQSPFDVLRGRFQFERIVLDPSSQNDRLDRYDQMENIFVHILRFRNFHFQPAD